MTFDPYSLPYADGLRALVRCDFPGCDGYGDPAATAPLIASDPDEPDVLKLPAGWRTINDGTGHLCPTHANITDWCTCPEMFAALDKDGNHIGCGRPIIGGKKY